MSLKVITWNMARNSVGRSTSVHNTAWDYLREMDFDVAAVQEVTVPPWATEHWIVVAPAVRFWGSALLARRGIDLQPSAEIGTTTLDRHGYLAWGELHGVASEPIQLASIHAPVGKATGNYLGDLVPEEIRRPSHRHPYRTDVAFALVRQRVGAGRFLVAGDWNVSRLWDTNRSITECHEFFDRAAEAGWVECSLSEPEVRTWFRGSEPPYQADHVFCDSRTGTAVRMVGSDPDAAAVHHLSDHAPLIFELG